MKDSIEGVVIEVTSAIARVKINRHSDCSNCGLCPGEDAMVLEALNTLNTKPGQRVILEVKEKNMLMAAFAVYILPLIAVAGGIYLGYFFASIFKIADVLPMTIGGVVFGSLAILAIKRLDISLQSATEMPEIVKLIE
jgi:sigma-E factor negative regulatory protein RseC